MKRRNFIKLSATASALTLLPNEVFAMLKSSGMNNCPNNSNKKIVLIQLQGANDGLNTVIPINQYIAYANLRPNIKIKNSGTGAFINLDTTLTTQNQVGLHPSLSGFKQMYDSGKMRIIQGVGYPIQDKSHFKSTDLWLTGGDGTQLNNNISSGWMGRFLENYYENFLTANFPLGIQLGSSENSLGFHGAEEHGLSMNMNGQDAAGFYSVINGLGGAPPTNIPNSEYGDLIQHILNIDSSTNIYANTISTAFNAGTNAVTYPNTGLANQLKSVAKFISGGLQTKIYLVRIGGFDTHDAQVQDTANTHLGTHANLLAQVSDAVNSFITDLSTQNIGDDVVAVTFSEFGRKIAENGGLGTDHGEVAPLFVFGNAINPGVSGTNINLAEALPTNNYQVTTVQHDYRRVFATIMQDWLGANNTTLNLTFYDQTNSTGFTKINQVIKPGATVSPECYVESLLSVPTNDVIKDEVLIFPNPSADLFEINTTSNIDEVSIFTIDGRKINTYKNPQVSNQMNVSVHQLPVGFYNIQIKTDNGMFSKKVVVRR
jgi:uncharacterized protein (DUF1501 family)